MDREIFWADVSLADGKHVVKRAARHQQLLPWRRISMELVGRYRDRPYCPPRAARAGVPVCIATATSAAPAPGESLFRARRAHPRDNLACGLLLGELRASLSFRPPWACARKIIDACFRRDGRRRSAVIAPWIITVADEHPARNSAKRFLHRPPLTDILEVHDAQHGHIAARPPAACRLAAQMDSAAAT